MSSILSQKVPIVHCMSCPSQCSHQILLIKASFSISRMQPAPLVFSLCPLTRHVLIASMLWHGRLEFLPGTSSVEVLGAIQERANIHTLASSIQAQLLATVCLMVRLIPVSQPHPHTQPLGWFIQGPTSEQQQLSYVSVPLSLTWYSLKEEAVLCQC